MLKQKGLLILLVLSSFFMLFRLGNGSLCYWDESIYAEVSREMVETGDWLTLHWNYEEWFHKPPLCIWFTAIAYKIFGVSEFSARLYSAISGIGCIIVLYLFTLRMFDKKSALISAMVLLSTTSYLKFSKMGMMDIPILFFITLAMYLFYLGINGDFNKFIFSGIITGFAVMTKGVVGLLIIVIQIVFIIINSGIKGFNKHWFIGMALGSVIFLPWHIYQHFIHEGSFFNQYIGYHVVSRLKGIGIHQKPFFYYLLVLIEYFSPWIVVLPFAVVYSIKKVFIKYRKEIILLSVWACVIFLIFSFSKTKLKWYIFPLFPAISVIVGCSIANWTKKINFNYIMMLCLFMLLLNIPFNRRIFTMDFNPELKYLSSKVKNNSNINDELFISEDIQVPVPLFYSNRKTSHIKASKKIIKMLNNKERLFLVLLDHEYMKLKKHIKGNTKIEYTTKGNYVLLCKY